MINKFVFVYLGDILIFSRTEEHKLHVRHVLKRLLENCLFVKAEKCEFLCQTTTFLDYIISTGSLGMDPAKVEAVTGWLQPEDREALQCFLGFANFYRRFIRNYSTVSAPLTAPTSINVKFSWNEKAEAAFKKLKQLFTTVPILIHPDPEEQFIVEVDASNISVGAVLSQRSSVHHKVHPCAFFSHRLSPAEQNYDIGNRDCWQSSSPWKNGANG